MFDWENELKSLAEFIQTKDAEYGQTYDKAGKILDYKFLEENIR
jgi:hypothetical protein